VEDSDNLQRLRLWIVHDQIVRVGMHNPEANRQPSQVVSLPSSKRRISEKVARSKYSLFDAIRSRRDCLGLCSSKCPGDRLWLEA
jgi:hypothetical protein